MKKLFYCLPLFVGLIFFSVLSEQGITTASISNVTKAKPRIALIGVHDTIYDPCGKYAHVNKKRYAEKHGYDVFLYTELLDQARAPYWHKVVAVKRHLADYDWLFWLDSDALIMNSDIKLEDLIDERYDFITTRDCLLNVNSGQWLIKNSKWSFDFLELWYNNYGVNIDGAVQDNGALIKIFKESEDIRNHTKIIPLRMLSSYPVCPLHYIVDGQYVDGDFIIHAAGCATFTDKIEVMRKFFKQLYPNDPMVQ